MRRFLNVAIFGIVTVGAIGVPAQNSSLQGPTVVPQGSTPLNYTPLGMSSTGTGSSDLEIRLRTSCYGTNLRAHPNPLGTQDTVHMRLDIPGQKEKLWVQFPSMLVMALSDSRVQEEFRKAYQIYDDRRSKTYLDVQEMVDHIKYIVQKAPSCGDVPLGLYMAQPVAALRGFRQAIEKDINPSFSGSLVPGGPTFLSGGGSLISSGSLSAIGSGSSVGLGPGIAGPVQEKKYDCNDANNLAGRQLAGLQMSQSPTFSRFRLSAPIGGSGAKAWQPWMDHPVGTYNVNAVWAIFWHKLLKGGVVERNSNGAVSNFVLTRDAQLDSLAVELYAVPKVSEKSIKMYDHVFGPEPINPPNLVGAEYKRFFEKIKEDIRISPELDKAISDHIKGPQASDMKPGECVMPPTAGTCNTPVVRRIGNQWRVINQNWSPVNVSAGSCCIHKMEADWFDPSKNFVNTGDEKYSVQFKQGIVVVTIQGGRIAPPPGPYDNRAHLAMIRKPFIRKTPPVGNPTYQLDLSSISTFPTEIHSREASRVLASLVVPYGARMNISPDGGILEINSALPGMQGFCLGYYSPLMLFFDEKRPIFSNRSTFLRGTDTFWVENNHPGYFLGIDKDGDGVLSGGTELFGDQTGERNGFEALREEIDSNGDQKIDARDTRFSKLLLWNDTNGDGVCQESELQRAAAAGLKEINTVFIKDRVQAVGDKADMRERSHFKATRAGKSMKGEIVDVWFRSP